MGWILIPYSRGSTMILSSKGFLDPSVVYSFFPLDDLFILIEGFLESSWWFLRRPREGFCIYMSSMTGPGALSLLSCCCRHEDRGGVLDLVGHMTLPAPHAPIYSPPFPSPAHSPLAIIAMIDHHTHCLQQVMTPLLFHCVEGPPS
jgi:hypothetical protein